METLLNSIYYYSNTSLLLKWVRSWPTKPFHQWVPGLPHRGVPEDP